MTSSARVEGLSFLLDTPLLNICIATKQLRFSRTHVKGRKVSTQCRGVQRRRMYWNMQPECTVLEHVSILAQVQSQSKRF